MIAFRTYNFTEIKHKQPARPWYTQLLTCTLDSRAEDTKTMSLVWDLQVDLVSHTERPRDKELNR